MKRYFIAFVALLCLGALPLRAQVVVNEVFAGGSNSGAPFNQDYVELFNNGEAGVDLGGFSLQYATATGATFSNIITFASGTFIGAGQFFVITASTAGATGAAVPNVTHTGATVGLANAGGKIRFLDSSGTPIIVDFVGWGTADTREGAGNAPAMTNTTSLQRIPNGFDSNNNNLDFQLLGPSPGALNVPEPSTYAMMGLGAALLVGMQRLRRKS